MMPIGGNMDYTGDLSSISDRFGTKKPEAKLPVCLLGLMAFIMFLSSDRTSRDWRALSEMFCI